MAQQTRLRGKALIEEFPEAFFLRGATPDKQSTTMKHVTHINKATARRGVFCTVRPEAI
jgi:hypothetical protein